MSQPVELSQSSGKGAGLSGTVIDNPTDTRSDSTIPRKRSAEDEGSAGEARVPTEMEDIYKRLHDRYINSLPKQDRPGSWSPIVTNTFTCSCTVLHTKPENLKKWADFSLGDALRTCAAATSSNDTRAELATKMKDGGVRKGKGAVELYGKNLFEIAQNRYRTRVDEMQAKGEKLPITTEMFEMWLEECVYVLDATEVRRRYHGVHDLSREFISRDTGFA